MAQHEFHLKGTWTGGRLGEGRIAVGGIDSAVSVPGSMGGPGVGTNPDDMLVGSAATCYLITLAAVLENRKLPVVELTLSSVGVVNDEGGLKFQSITHRPHLVLASDATDEQVQTAIAACERAEKHCMISKALRGNVDLHVEPTVTKQA